MQDFIDYLKSEFFDAVYLQQNAFDKVDEFCPADRQKYVFGVIEKIIEKDFDFEEKDVARRYFQDLRSKFITWNTTEFESDEFKKIEKELQELGITKNKRIREHPRHLCLPCSIKRRDHHEMEVYHFPGRAPPIHLFCRASRGL